MAELFEVTVTDTGETTVLGLHGDVDRDAGPGVDAALEQVPAGNRIVLDFSPTAYINSSGIALIVSILARARAEGRTVAAFGLSDHYREIFEITRLSDFIEICTDRASAIGQLA